MTVQVNEIIIRATITDASAAPPAGGGTGNAQEKEEIITECVEQVLEILRRDNKR
ncbi:MAG: DUF5908 family protein [Bacteroidia bacterium]|jgi:hypothetical protein|nr:DUF5908 family protein [Bacteroidia bacterium]